MKDHSSLQWLLKQDLPKGRLLNWAYRLRQYDFTIEYRRGANNPCADALSRLVSVVETLNIGIGTKTRDARKPLFMKKKRRIVLPAEVKESKEVEAKYPEAKPKVTELVFPNHPRWKEATLSDKHLGPIMKAKLGESKVAPTSTLGKLLPNFELVDNILCLKRGGAYKAAVPLQFRRQLMTVYHNNKLAGHRGHQQTATLIEKTYWWPGMAPDIRGFAQACIWCSVAKV